MSDDILLYEQSGHVVTLTMNQPEVRNAIGGGPEIEAMIQAVDRINRDKSVRAVILTGAGKAFSAGGNIKAMNEKDGIFSGGAGNIREGYRNSIHKMVRAIWALEVPAIAAVNGPAIGLGCDITCLCDTRIAADSAKFGVTFLKLGLNPGDGGAWLLPKVIGMARASELFYSGDVVDANTAKEYGLVSRVVPGDMLMEEAQALASRFAQQPPDVLRMTKRLLRAGMTSTFDTVMEMSAGYQAVAHSTDDHMEALSAFFEKRDGNYTGN
ncbi:MAG: crotonase/enoyl-CoA hydratase family protein [Alphaproteobacteria bacterium]